MKMLLKEFSFDDVKEHMVKTIVECEIEKNIKDSQEIDFIMLKFNMACLEKNNLHVNLVDA